MPQQSSPHLLHHHELLDVNIVIGMRTAVEDIHHRQGQLLCVCPTDIAVKRLPEFIGGGVRDSERNPQNGVRAEAALVLCAVQFAHRDINLVLRKDIVTLQLPGDGSVDVVDSFLHTFA